MCEEPRARLRRDWAGATLGYGGFRVAGSCHRADHGEAGPETMRLGSPTRQGKALLGVESVGGSGYV